MRIESIHLPATLTKISLSAFMNCPYVHDIYWEGTMDQWVNINFEGVGANPCGQNSVNFYVNGTTPTSYAFPSGTTEIKKFALEGVKGLTSVTIPNSVTSIGQGAFSACSNLTSINIPNSVTSIGGSAFSECTSLQSLTLGNGLTSIPTKAFKDTYNMTAPLIIPDSVTIIGVEAFGKNSASSITIGTGITEIDEIAFYHNQACTSITIKATNPPTLKNINAFQTNGGGVKTCPIYVPAGSVEAYKTAAVWKDLPNADTRIQAIPNS